MASAPVSNSVFLGEGNSPPWPEQDSSPSPADLQDHNASDTDNTDDADDANNADDADDADDAGDADDADSDDDAVIVVREAIATPVTPAPSTYKRKASVPAEGSVKWRATQSQPRVQYSDEMTARLIGFLRDKAIAGSFRIDRMPVMRPAFERVAERMDTEFPLPDNAKWSVPKIKHKYDNEKKRFRLWLNFLAISGTSYNEETGLVEGSVENFEAFVRKHPKSDWLRTKPLGNADAYRDVFAKEQATGDYIRTAAEAEEVIDTDNASDSPLVPASSRESSLSRLPSSSPAPNQHRKLHRETDTAFLARNIFKSFTSLAQPGHNDIEIAWQDLQKLFGDKITGAEMAYCMMALKDPSNAAMWNNAKSLPLKECFVNMWKERR